MRLFRWALVWCSFYYSVEYCFGLIHPSPDTTMAEGTCPPTGRTRRSSAIFFGGQPRALDLAGVTNLVGAPFPRVPCEEAGYQECLQMRSYATRSRDESAGRPSFTRGPPP